MNDNQISSPGGRVSINLQPPANPSPRILLVDADYYLRRLNAEVLAHYGYHVNAAKDGLNGWEALNADYYDLLITGQDMPNMSGVELLKQMHGARMSLPVIMATETVPSGEFQRQPWLRPAVTLLKPYTTADLLDTVQAVLRMLSAPHGPALQSTLPPSWREPAVNRSATAGDAGVNIPWEPLIHPLMLSCHE